MPLAKTESYHLVSFILLFVVSFIATMFKLGPVLLASSVSALAWNYYFIPPHYTFHIAQTDDILIFGLFFIIALLNGILTTRIRRQEQLVREREARTNDLLQLTKLLARAGHSSEITDVAISQISQRFGITPQIYIQDGNNNLVLSETITPDISEIVQLTFRNQQCTGAGTSYQSHSNHKAFPLTGASINTGVLVVSHVLSESNFDQNPLWDAFLVQIANALERDFLSRIAQKASFLDESARLYRTLFNSISHEFRIPVATIMGASDTLLNETHNGEIRLELYNEINTASRRLNRLIGNLLNMSRLESGFLSVRRDWHDINDLINKVTNELEEELKYFNIIILVADDMPLVKIDFGLMEQVLYNLIINASQHTADNSEIELLVSHNIGEMIITINDNGSGFPPEGLEHVFDKFYRINDSKPGGLGLGLSIAKGFVEAHGGKIHLENRKEGGACFTIWIPTEDPYIEQLQTT